MTVTLKELVKKHWTKVRSYPGRGEEVCAPWMHMDRKGLMFLSECMNVQGQLYVVMRSRNDSIRRIWRLT
jgi:hypothetical protein